MVHYFHIYIINIIPYLSIQYKIKLKINIILISIFILYNMMTNNNTNIDTNTDNNNEFPFLKPYKKKNECRVFIEDILNILVPFTLVVGGILLVAFLVPIL